ncbi:MAG: flagellar hook capping FlgD N-terminal domain-containing protein [Phycisphaerae bacterium]|nr:flagellar hook capping FlgD N-terminal domain-containing protein [Phycisphaerae bacterium]
MASIGNVGSASNIQMDYMKLLTTQLKNQNPLEPLDNNQMAAQLAQFSQLQQLENMNSSFGQVLRMSQESYAASLIGKNISYLAQQKDMSIEQTEGVVEKVHKSSDGEILLEANGVLVGLEDVLSVR